MEFASVQKALETLALKPWGEQHPVALEDRPHEAGNSKYFIRHSVLFGTGEATSLGTGCVRYPLIQYMVIHFQDGAGNASMLKIADALCKYYNMKTVTSTENAHPAIVLHVPSMISFPKDEKGYRQLQVICPGYFDTRS